MPLGVVLRAGAGGGRRHGVRVAMTGSALIRVDALEKRYGERTVLRGVQLAVDRGDLHVVTGPNGSGKTTLLRVLVGLAAPSRGTVDVTVDRSRIGYVGHDSHLYADLTALENLELYGRLYRVPERRERIGMLLERFGLWEARSRRVGSFSRGMTQRLALCRALLHEPELLVLDEPYSALDTDGASLLDDELASAGETRAVVVATHEPERLATLATGHLALGAA